MEASEAVKNLEQQIEETLLKEEEAQHRFDELNRRRTKLSDVQLDPYLIISLGRVLQPYLFPWGYRFHLKTSSVMRQQLRLQSGAWRMQREGW